MKKRIIACVMAAVIAVFAISFTVFADSTPTLTATPSATSVTQGRSFTLSIKASAFDTVSSVDFKIHYDSAAMTVKSYSNGGLIADANKIQWKYFNPEEAPKQEFWKPWSKDRQYCGEQLKWTEMTWECANANSNATGFSEIVHLLYKDFYAVVTEGKAPEITHDQVRRQVYIMEEAHKQNPLPKKPLA